VKQRVMSFTLENKYSIKKIPLCNYKTNDYSKKNLHIFPNKNFNVPFQRQISAKYADISFISK
jgi:hypothetical protein